MISSSPSRSDLDTRIESLRQARAQADVLVAALETLIDDFSLSERRNRSNLQVARRYVLTAVGYADRVLEAALKAQHDLQAQESGDGC